MVGAENTVGAASERMAWHHRQSRSPRASRAGAHTRTDASAVWLDLDAGRQAAFSYRVHIEQQPASALCPAPLPAGEARDFGRQHRWLDRLGQVAVDFSEQLAEPLVGSTECRQRRGWNSSAPLGIERLNLSDE